MKTTLKTLAAGSLVLAMTGCAAADQSLTLYSGRNEALVQPLIDDFVADTGIEVEVRYAGTAELAAQLLEESNSPADVYLAQDGGALGAVAKAGLFVDLPSDILELVPAAYADPEGQWVGVSGRARVLVYDPAKVSDVPASVFDLEDASWEGRIGIAPNNGSFQSFVTAMRVTEGEAATSQWLDAMKVNGVPYAKNGDILEAVESGQLDAGLINHYYWNARVLEEGIDNISSRIAFFTNQDVGNLVNVAGVGALNTDDATLEFIRYLLSDSAQSYFATETREYPLVATVSPADDLVPLSEIPAPQIDLGDIDELDITLELIRNAGLN